MTFSLSLSSLLSFLSLSLHIWTKVFLVAHVSDTQKSKNQVVKGTVLPKMKILSSFIYPLVSFQTCLTFSYTMQKKILY